MEGTDAAGDPVVHSFGKLAEAQPEAQRVQQCNAKAERIEKINKIG